jgi:hypothetical protein
MIKRLNKKIAFGTSIIISGLLGYVFTATNGTAVNPVDAVLEAPIFSIEKASADGDGGCSSGACDTVVYPTSTGATGVAVFFSSP